MENVWPYTRSFLRDTDHEIIRKWPRRLFYTAGTVGVDNTNCSEMNWILSELTGIERLSTRLTLTS